MKNINIGMIKILTGYVTELFEKLSKKFNCEYVANIDFGKKAHIYGRKNVLH